MLDPCCKYSDYLEVITVAASANDNFLITCYLQKRGRPYVCMQSLMVLVCGVWVIFPLGHGASHHGAVNWLKDYLLFVFNSR